MYQELWEKQTEKQLLAPGKVGVSFTKEKTAELGLKRLFQGKEGMGGERERRVAFPKTRITEGKASHCNYNGSVRIERLKLKPRALAASGLVNWSVSLSS